MVFANLQQHEKAAFFSLLDEYFSSRPEIFANAAQSDGASAQSAAASAVHRAMVANPEATAKVMSAGLRQVANSRASPGAGGSGTGPSAGAGASDNEGPSMAGRVAAASLAFSASRNNRAASPSSASGPPSSVSNLTAVKKFGDIDTSSGKAFFGSLRNSNKGPSPPPPVVPAAFASRQSNYGPPPVRRVASNANVSAREPTPEPAPPPPPPPPPPAPRYQPPQQQEEAGEWVEALYDYDSGEAGDLKIAEGQRILVVERTSDDWWTGEVSGKKGLFPASYVKLL